MSHRQPRTPEPGTPARILRMWQGATRAADAAIYADYMARTGFPALKGSSGNLGVLGLQRITGDRAEHLVLSLWESEEAIRGFAGDELRRAVFYPEDEGFLVERDEYADHFEVVFQGGWERG